MHRRLIAGLARPLLVATVVGVTLLGGGCGGLGQQERAAAERACAAEMPAAQPEVRDGYFYTNNNAGTRDFTVLEPGNNTPAERIFMDTCVAGRLNLD